jgi:hypothetical protein
MQYARCHVVEADDESNDYQDYFQYVMSTCALTKPNDWKEALELFHTLVGYAKNGS